MATPAPQKQELIPAPNQAMTPQVNARPIDKFKAYANSAEVFEAFKRVLGDDKEAQQYIGSVIVAVYNKDELQSCSPKSIMVSAMRAAYLRLSVDPAMKQAHLVPFANEATLIVDYHGLVQLMTNTGLYDDINVCEVYEGEKVVTRRPSSRVDIEGEKLSDTVIGWLAYFREKSGMEKFLYMTNEECDEYGKTYSKSYNSSKSAWNSHNGKDRPAMRRKTALRRLANQWGKYSPYAAAVLRDEDGVTEGISVSLPDEQDATKTRRFIRSEKSNVAALGFDEMTHDDREQERAAFLEWANGATRRELEFALTKGMADGEREILTDELSKRPPVTDPMFPYDSNEITMACAAQWDEAPAKVRTYLQGLYETQQIPDMMSVEESGAIPRPATTPPPAGQTAKLARPLSPEDLKRGFTARAAALEMDGATCSESDRKVVASAIDAIFDGSETMRYEVCGWLTDGVSSTQKMSAGQIGALMGILGVKFFKEAPCPESMQEFKQAHAAALVAAGQQEMHL